MWGMRRLNTVSFAIVTFMAQVSQSWDVHPARWLEAAFGSESRVRILRFLAETPRAARTEREIARAIGMSPNAVNKAIRGLHQSGVLEVEKAGNAHVVRLHASDRLLRVLRSVFQTEVDLLADVVGAIEAALPADAVCYLYGSSVRATAHGGSDVDLLVIAKDREAAAEAAYAIEREVHETVPANLHVIAIDAAEARRRLRQRGGVVRAAVEQGQRLGLAALEEVVRA